MLNLLVYKFVFEQVSWQRWAWSGSGSQV